MSWGKGLGWKILKRVAIWIAASAVLLTSCLSESTSEKEKELVGTWFTWAPTAAGAKPIACYICFGGDGAYSFFSLTTWDTVTLAKVEGIQRKRGTWTQAGDTLKINEVDVGYVLDSGGVGQDWERKMKMNPLPHAFSVPFQVRKDSLLNFLRNGEMQVSIKREPHDLLKGFCPGL